MKLFKIDDRIPDDEYITDIFYGMDTGFMVSATAVVACAFTNKYNVYVLDTFYSDPTKYVRKPSPEEQAKHIHQFIEDITNKYGVMPGNMTIDSADGGIFTQYWQLYNVQWSKVHKLSQPAMIDRVQDLLAQERLHVLKTPNNEILLDQHKKYQWDPATIHSDNPEVIKEDDHTCDALKYGVLDNEQLLGLAV